ncbi:Stb3p [Nakaseomyces bracarensis]|uniref:Stb3p n=1 Tax=Nakaseomyces bracarensis TaxID=273131 RepID=UPI00387266B8
MTVSSEKPLSTSSPEAMAAASMVTPQLLSNLLINRGPLAVRHITNALFKEIPDFQKLSSSKQRRLIMAVMESGDRQNHIIFEKIGWGQWTAKVVPPHNFDELLKITNINNAKIKDMVAQESQRRRNSKKERSPSSSEYSNEPVKEHSNEQSHVTSNLPHIEPSPEHPNEPSNEHSSDNSNISSGKLSPKSEPATRATVYIDENALASDDEEEDHRDLLFTDSKSNQMNGNETNGNTPLNLDRRKSTILVSDSSPEANLEFELLAQKVRPIIKGRRRSSVKTHSPFVIKPNNGSHLDASVFRHSNNSTSAIIHSTNNSTSHSPVNPITNGSKDKIDLDTLPSSEPTSRRASRLSSSKESSIRSTLFPNKNYRWISKNPGIVNSTSNLNKQTSDTLKVSHYDIANVDNVLNDHHSDTDEEDWASIGAASLRRNSALASTISLENCSPSPNSDENINVIHVKPNEISTPPHKRGEDKSAAYLLMSLKS